MNGGSDAIDLRRVNGLSLIVDFPAARAAAVERPHALAEGVPGGQSTRDEDERADHEVEHDAASVFVTTCVQVHRS